MGQGFHRLDVPEHIRLRRLEPLALPLIREEKCFSAWWVGSHFLDLLIANRSILGLEIGQQPWNCKKFKVFLLRRIAAA